MLLNHVGITGPSAKLMEVVDILSLSRGEKKSRAHVHAALHTASGGSWDVSLPFHPPGSLGPRREVPSLATTQLLRA